MIHIEFDATRIKQQFAGMPEVIDKALRSTMRNIVGHTNDKPTELGISMERLMVPNIDRPTPFTANGKGIAFYGTVNDSGPPMATFGMKRKQAPYLQFILKGVPRDQKIIEKRTPDGRLMIPSNNIKLDRYGNVPKALYERIFVQAFSNNKDSPYYFQPRAKGKTPAGIYLRKDLDGKRHGTQLQFLVVDRIGYEQAWDFYAAGRKEILRLLPAAMEEAIRVRTAQYLSK